MNLIEILILCGLSVMVIAAVLWIIIRKKKGKGSCSCSCENCPYPCHKK